MQHSKAKSPDIKRRNTLDNILKSQSIRKEATEYFLWVLCGYFRISAVIHRNCLMPVENQGFKARARALNKGHQHIAQFLSTK